MDWKYNSSASFCCLVYVNLFFGRFALFSPSNGALLLSLLLVLGMSSCVEADLGEAVQD